MFEELFTMPAAAMIVRHEDGTIGSKDRCSKCSKGFPRCAYTREWNPDWDFPDATTCYIKPAAKKRKG